MCSQNVKTSVCSSKTFYLSQSLGFHRIFYFFKNSLFFFSLVGEDSLSSGSVISVPEEGEILVPPPPSIAPPPPPGAFILPPPDFMGELTEPVYMTPSMVEEDFSLLKPPPMAPPKPPSVCSSGSTSSLPVSGPPDTVPEPPKFAAPQPPSERQTKTSKTPPPKPIRLSSMTNLIDSPPQTPAPPPPVQMPTLSTFNPQNTAKIYNMPKTSILSKYENHEQRPKQILLLEDSVKPAPVAAQFDGKGPKTQPKPVPKDVQELKDRLDISNHSPSPLPEPKKEVKTVTLSSSLENGKPLQTPTQTSPQLQKEENGSGVILEPSKDKPEKSSSQGHRFSPLLERKLRNLKIGENNAPREGHAASPLALLMAAKERDKHRSNHFLSQENSSTKNKEPMASIHPSDSSPNSFTVTPRSSSSPSLTSTDILQENNKSANIVTATQIQTSPQSASPALAKDQTLPSSLTKMAKSQSTTNLIIQPQSTQHKDDKEDLNIPFIPPPPEFDDLDKVVEPPSILPPDPPIQKAATQNARFLSPAPPPSPKPSPPQLPKPLPPQAAKKTPPEAPKLPPPQAPKLPTPVSKPKPQVQTKPKVASDQLPSALSPSQATLLSILQKKMLEMDHKMASVKETESSSDDWGTPSSEENNRVPVVPRATPLSKNGPVVNKAAAVDMKELEGKMAKRFQETSSVKVPTR